MSRASAPSAPPVHVLVATLAGLTNLTLGVIGHEGNTLLVVLNGLRLLRARPIAV